MLENEMKHWRPLQEFVIIHDVLKLVIFILYICIITLCILTVLFNKTNYLVLILYLNQLRLPHR